MEYQKAYEIATRIKDELAPHCERIEIAGSIRRKKDHVKDIELVLIPKPYDTGLFASGVAKVLDQYKIIKGKLPCRYTQRELPEGIKLDVFFADEINWGWILALRTGSSDYNLQFIMPALKLSGARAVDGYICYKGNRQALREERDLFRLIGIPMPAPEYRGLAVPPPKDKMSATEKQEYEAALKNLREGKPEKELWQLAEIFRNGGQIEAFVGVCRALNEFQKEKSEQL